MKENIVVSEEILDQQDEIIDQLVEIRKHLTVTNALLKEVTDNLLRIKLNLGMTIFSAIIMASIVNGILIFYLMTRRW